MIINNEIDLIQFWRENIKGCLSFVYVDGSVVREDYQLGIFYPCDMPVLNRIIIIEDEKNTVHVQLKDMTKINEYLKTKDIVSISGDKYSLTIEIKEKIDKKGN